MTITISYRCRQCGRVFNFEEEIHSSEVDRLNNHQVSWREEQEGKMNKTKGIRGIAIYGGTMPLIMTHVCGEKKIGIGDLIGVSEWEE